MQFQGRGQWWGGSYRKAHSTADLKISASSSSLKSRAKNAQNLAELERELSHLKRLQSAKTLADSNKMRMLFNMFRLIEIPNSRACWVSISRAGAGSRGLAAFKIRNGTLEPWNPETLEPRNPGTLEPWNPGTLEP